MVPRPRRTRLCGVARYLTRGLAMDLAPVRETTPGPGIIPMNCEMLFARISSGLQMGIDPGSASSQAAPQMAEIEGLADDIVRESGGVFGE